MPRFGQSPAFTGQDTSDLVDISTWDAMKATASQTFGTSPTVSMLRAEEVTADRERREGYFTPAGYVAPREASPKLTREQAQAKVDAVGLTDHLKIPEDGENQGALDLLIDYKTRELRNQFLLDRYRGGVGGGAVQLGTALATSLADPINIASAFVPVVGEARYAQILGRAGTSLAGRAATRAGLGAVEGAAGAALVEPVVYFSQQELQADYTSADSLNNIAFGGLFGGVLQPGAGFFADIMARRSNTGAWADAVTVDGMLDTPEMPETFVMGGGARYITGDDYARGAFAVVDAKDLQRPAGDGFPTPDQSQLGESPYADSGAPVLNQDGSVSNGNKRLAAVLDAYGRGEADDYRTGLVGSAARYGLDSEVVEGMASPVLVRVQSALEAGRWAQDRKLYESSPRARFENPDEVVKGQFRRKARELGVSDEVVRELEPSAPIDSVTGFYDGQTDAAKAALVERAQKHVAETGESAIYVSGDIVNLGGINAHSGDRAAVANAHYRAMTDIMRDELTGLGTDVVPMRTGGDELGAVVIGVDRSTVDAALNRAQARIQEYAELNGLANIDNPKRPGEYGTGMHFGTAEIDPRLTEDDITNAADSGVGLSKKGGGNVARDTTGPTGAVPSGGRPGGLEAGTGTKAGGLRAEGSRAARLTDEQHRSALQAGVAQAVNGEQVAPGPAAQVGTAQGVARFLEDRRIAEEAERLRLDRAEALTAASIADLVRFDPADAAKLDEDVKALEASLREQIRATGGDERALDAALEESTELAAELKVESQAIKGISVCLLRGG